MAAKPQLLVDTVQVTMQLVESDSGSDVLIARGRFGAADNRTANGRIYPGKIMTRELERLAESIKGRKVYGELDHPMDGKTKLTRVSHIVTDLGMNEENEVIGETEILNTTKGKDLKVIIEAGGAVGVSSRGFGTTKQVGKDLIVQDDFRLMTYDFVATPADEYAYPEFTTEGDTEEGEILDADGKVVIADSTEEADELAEANAKLKSWVKGLSPPSRNDDSSLSWVSYMFQTAEPDQPGDNKSVDKLGKKVMKLFKAEGSGSKIITWLKSLDMEARIALSEKVQKLVKKNLDANIWENAEASTDDEGTEGSEGDDSGEGDSQDEGAGEGSEDSADADTDEGEGEGDAQADEGEASEGAEGDSEGDSEEESEEGTDDESEESDEDSEDTDESTTSTEELAKLGRIAGYQLYVEREVYSYHNRDEIIELIGDLGKFDKIDDLEQRTAIVIDKIGVTHEEHFDVEATQEENDELSTEVANLRERNTELSESLKETIDLAKRLGLKAYTETLLSDNPDRVAIRQRLEVSKPDTMEAVAGIVESYNAGSDNARGAKIVNDVQQHLEKGKKSLEEDTQTSEAAGTTSMVESGPSVMGVPMTTLKQIATGPNSKGN